MPISLPIVAIGIRPLCNAMQADSLWVSTKFGGNQRGNGDPGKSHFPFRIRHLRDPFPRSGSPDSRHFESRNLSSLNPSPHPLTLTPIAGIPIVREGDDVASLVGDAIGAAGIVPADFDVVVVTQKIVSKAEGRHIRLADVAPSPRAVELAASLGKDPRMIEVVLGESNEVVAHGHGVLVAEHRSGHVMANAGVDRSNVGCAGVGGPGSSKKIDDDAVGDEAAGEDVPADDTVLLLPSDPDASAAALHRTLEARFGCRLAVVISDSVGRAWRHGVAGIAVGAAGLPSLVDLRGAPDLFGEPLKVTLAGFADQIASAANLVAGEGGEGVPAVHVRGLAWSGEPAPARALVREREHDLFR